MDNPEIKNLCLQLDIVANRLYLQDLLVLEKTVRKAIDVLKDPENVPQWENEAKRAFWSGYEIGSVFGGQILPRWNEYIKKRKGELSESPAPKGE